MTIAATHPSYNNWITISRTSRANIHQVPRMPSRIAHGSFSQPATSSHSRIKTSMTSEFIMNGAWKIGRYQKGFKRLFPTSTSSLSAKPTPARPRQHGRSCYSDSSGILNISYLTCAEVQSKLRENIKSIKIFMLQRKRGWPSCLPEYLRAEVYRDAPISMLAAAPIPSRMQVISSRTIQLSVIQLVHRPHELTLHGYAPRTLRVTIN